SGVRGSRPLRRAARSEPAPRVRLRSAFLHGGVAGAAGAAGDVRRAAAPSPRPAPRGRADATPVVELHLWSRGDAGRVHAGERPVVTHDDLMADAVAETGLDDFGDDSFREGLEILVRALGHEARLNAAGEAFLYPRIVGHLAQRLQVEDWYRRHPEIDDVVIGMPLFGVSLPRTGSTALSCLLAQDPG